MIRFSFERRRTWHWHIYHHIPYANAMLSYMDTDIQNISHHPLVFQFVALPKSRITFLFTSVSILFAHLPLVKYSSNICGCGNVMRVLVCQCIISEKKGFYGSSFMIKRSVFFSVFYYIYFYYLYILFAHISKRDSKNTEQKHDILLLLNLAEKLNQKEQIEKK